MTNTHELTQNFQFLTQQDIKLSQEIDVMILKIDKLKHQALSWNQKIAQNQRECDERNKALREEKNAILGHFKALKKRMYVVLFRQKEWGWKER